MPQDTNTVRDRDTGEEITHYAWTTWMWCVNAGTVAGDFDAVQEAGECPACEVAL